jgi:UDP-glucose 6-dehydrogenase
VASPAEVLVGAEVAVVATAWPEFRALSPDAVVAAMKTPCIIDPWRFLADILGADARIHYLAVGTPLRRQESARRPGA